MEQQGFVDSVISDRPNCPYAVFPGGATADRDEMEVKVKMMGAIAPLGLSLTIATRDRRLTILKNPPKSPTEAR